MKKIILLLFLLLNVFPYIEHGKLTIGGAGKAFAQSLGEEVEVCAGLSTSEYRDGCWINYVTCVVDKDCDTGQPIGPERDCDLDVTYDTNCGSGGDPGDDDPPCYDCSCDPSYCGSGGGGGSGPPPGGYPTDCAGVPNGTAYTDPCGTCVGGTTGKTVKTYYRDADGDGWGNSSQLKNCYDAGPGWVTTQGDYNDNCYNTANISSQCPPCTNDTFDSNSVTTTGGAPPSQQLGSGVYGMVWPEKVVINISACKDGNNWKAILTDLKGEYSLQARLLPGQQEVTGPGGNTTQANFCSQFTELQSLGNNGGPWYMLSAVIAHENAHVTHMEPSLKQVTLSIESAVEALTVPFTGQSQTDAISQIKALPNYAVVINQSQQTWLNELLSQAARDHAPGGICELAELAVVNPMINSICTHAQTQGWTGCTGCP